MTINELINRITAELQAAGVENSAGEARFIAEDVFGKDRTWLFLNGRSQAGEAECSKALEFAARRAKHEPIQYILGHADFMGLDIKVGPGVLIPRPETETLCQLASEELQKVSKAVKPLKILDLCTGSGCIAAYMQQSFPDGEVYAADISGDALSTAKQNLPASVKLLQGDLFDALKRLGDSESCRETEARENTAKPPEAAKAPEPGRGSLKFDLIISNPPYIPSPVVDRLEAEVKDHEPRLALDGGQEGMELNRRIISEAPDWLKPGGLLFMEVDETQRQLLMDACRACGRYSEFQVLQDLSGKDRYLRAVR